MNENDVQALKSCYGHSHMRVVHADGGKSAKIPPHRGLRQGCPLLPILKGSCGKCDAPVARFQRRRPVTRWRRNKCSMLRWWSLISWRQMHTICMFFKLASTVTANGRVWRLTWAKQKSQALTTNEPPSWLLNVAISNRNARQHQAADQAHVPSWENSLGLAIIPIFRYSAAIVN